MRYDAIVIGGGLNGLTCAAYLAKAGRKVLVLERRDRVGGSAVTEEFHPGFRVDTVRHDVGQIPIHIWRHLELEKHGLTVLSTNPSILAPGLDGSALLLDGGAHGEPSESLKRLSPTDAAKWPEFTRRVRALAGFLGEMYKAPMPGVDATIRDLPTLARLGLKLRGLGKKDMVELLRVLPMSVAELLDDWFENPILKGVIASRGIMHTCQGPRGAGTAFVMLHHQVGRHAGAFRSSLRPVGGVGAVAEAIAAAARASGAEVRTGAQVARILMKGGSAAGVVLASGEEIAATRVVSEASPRHTFLELCDPSQLSPEFVRAVGNIRYRGVFAKENLALDALPVFGRRSERSEEPAVPAVVIAPSIDYVERAYDCAKYGRVSDRPFLDILIPTISDPSLAPAGKHVMSVHVQYAPYHLREGAWDSAARDRLGDLVMKTLAEYAPGIENLVLHRQVLTPKDLEDEYSLPEGQAYHGELALDQALFMRPVPECSRYSTPVLGLSLCGSGTHPGGGIPGLAGAAAAARAS